MTSPSVFLLLSIALSISIAMAANNSGPLPEFREAPSYRNGPHCEPATVVHIAMTLDSTYLRGSLAGVLSVLRHSSCPESVHFHFLSTPRQRRRLRPLLLSTFPSLPFSLHPFLPSLVRSKISSSLRPALDQPLNYARIYLPHILPRHVTRVIYLDSDLILVDDVLRLWSLPLSPRHVIAAPEHCHANFSSYFTPYFWSHPRYPRVFDSRPRRPCYFNTGVMVMDLERWRAGGYTRRLEDWMEVQKRERIYELGSLPPFLLVFAGEVRGVEHRWNQHGLGGDNVEGLCRDLHPGPVSLLHWSGKGKPWLRLDAGRPCPLDYLWKPYDLLKIRGGADDDGGDLSLFADG